MESGNSYIDSALSFLRDGFNDINQVQGLLIALAATVFMQSWRQLLPVSLLAVVVHIGVNLLAPVLANDAAFRLPPIMEGDFWRMAAGLFVGYVIVISVFFFVKSLLLRRPAAAH
jgi:hypothetical protein